MSIPCDAAVRRPSILQRPALFLALLFLLPMAATLGLRAASLADPAVSAVRLDAGQARRANLGLALVPHPELPAALLEVRPAPGADGPGEATGSLLAAAADGRSVAIAEQLGPDPTTLVIANADGSQVRVPVNGLLAAGFAPDGSWLAATDGLGRIWRVDATTGGTGLVAGGPFAGSVLVEPGGSILALRVSSVEAPFLSGLVRLDPSGATAPLLPDEALVYGFASLQDGSLAVVSHRPSGTLVQTVSDGRQLAAEELGAGAVNVSISADGSVLAWELDGQVLLRSGDRPVRVIGPGARPRVAPNGELLLMDAPAGGTLVISRAGALIAELAGPVALLACQECRP